MASTTPTANMECTSWRGMQVDHPADWELAIACGADEPPHLAFADRHHHRLDLCWKALKFEPDLNLALQKHRRKTEKESDEVIHDLAGAPAGWRGIVRKTPEGTVINAIGFLPSVGWLVDATILWPGQRDTGLEGRILASIRAEDANQDPRLWQAMGISLTLGRRFDLAHSRSRVGQITWHFATGGKKGPALTVERIALPDHWLTIPLRDWLVVQAPAGHKTLRQDPAPVNRHRGETLLSARKISPLASMRGVRELRRSTAWLCPVEARVYRVSLTETSREPEIDLPRDLSIRCCRPVAPVKGHTK